MIGVLILTHGGLARELLASAETIAGNVPAMSALALPWTEAIDAARQRVGEEIDRLDRGQGVLVLTDLAGGTPCNIAMSFRREGRVAVVSGVNLPMVVRLCCSVHRDAGDLETMRHVIEEKGRAAIRSPLCSRDPAPPTEAVEPGADR